MTLSALPLTYVTNKSSNKNLNNQRIEAFDQIINTSLTVQGIHVVISPYTLDFTGNEKCSGPNDTLYFEITPTLRNRDFAKSFVFDTINVTCHGYSDGVIYLNSSGGITAYPEYTFDDLEYYFHATPGVDYRCADYVLPDRECTVLLAIHLLREGVT